jgi:hypothetical protein
MSDELRSEIEALRARTLPLEPDDGQRRALGERVLDHALDFLGCVEQAPSYRPSAEVFDRAFDPEFSDTGRSLDEVLDIVDKTVDRPGIATTSPRFMGYIPGGACSFRRLAISLPTNPTNMPDSPRQGRVPCASKTPASNSSGPRSAIRKVPRAR